MPQNDPSAVRGARNYPCQEFPGKRAPTVQLCRDPRGYVPIGNNPWRGPPVPTGTPIEDGRNILPPNKYPYIPPEADPDPGYPVPPGAVPPGVQPGPGPAPHQPWPVSAAAERQRAAAPADRVGAAGAVSGRVAGAGESATAAAVAGTLPAGGASARAGAGAAAGGRSGRAPAGRRDAAGGQLACRTVPTTSTAARSSMRRGNIAVYAPGAENMRPQENWVDLMLDPRQT